MQSKIIGFLKTFFIWIINGCKYRSEKRIKEIHDICKKCPYIEEGEGNLPGYDACGLCGCNLHPTKKLANKIAWRTTKCPDNPPRWK